MVCSCLRVFCPPLFHREATPLKAFDYVLPQRRRSPLQERGADRLPVSSRFGVSLRHANLTLWVSHELHSIEFFSAKEERCFDPH